MCSTTRSDDIRREKLATKTRTAATSAVVAGTTILLVPLAKERVDEIEVVVVIIAVVLGFLSAFLVMILLEFHAGILAGIFTVVLLDCLEGILTTVLLASVSLDVVVALSLSTDRNYDTRS